MNHRRVRPFPANREHSDRYLASTDPYNDFSGIATDQHDITIKLRIILNRVGEEAPDLFQKRITVEVIR